MNSLLGIEEYQNLQIVGSKKQSQLFEHEFRTSSSVQEQKWTVLLSVRTKVEIIFKMSEVMTFYCTQPYWEKHVVIIPI